MSRRPVSVAVGARGERPVLTPAQGAALARITARPRRAGRRASPPRSDRLGEDRGLSDRHRGGARAWARRDRPRAGDRAHAPDRLAVRGALRRPGRGAPLGAQRRRAPRRVASGSPRRGPGVRRSALGGVRAGGGPRPDRRGRGARLVLQAGVGPALRRSRRRRHRAHAEQAMLVAGTATPRPESWERLERVELSERADGSPMPGIEVLDMRERDGREGPLHARTREALARLAETGGKAIVMVPRRGWSPFLDCRVCGHAWYCPNCDVSLVLHRAGDTMRCHHCGHSERVPESCPECASVSIARHGAGSERVAEIVSELVAPVPVLRLDSDSAARKGAHAAILGEFDRAEAGVLIGTQMVAKGHDFPDVVLSVVVDADSSLRFPDFRAEERTFALVSQLAGRSGRGGAGRVLVQTLAPGRRGDHAGCDSRRGRLPGRRARAAARALVSAVRDARPRRDGGEGSTGCRERSAPDRRPAAAAPAARRDPPGPGAAVSPARPRAAPGPRQGRGPRRRRWTRSARPWTVRSHRR